MIDRLKIRASDGVNLEARIDSPDSPLAFVVFCHPHPLQRGTMMAPLMVAVTTRLTHLGFAVLRFNFRGTGESEGSHDYGKGELADVSAAVAQARDMAERVVLAGWSFGGAMAMNWLSSENDNSAYAVIAPPPDALDTNSPPGRGRIILGRREQVIDSTALMAYAADHSIDLVLTSGDHFFHGRGQKIGDLVGEALATR